MSAAAPSVGAGLAPEQREAVERRDGPLLLSANAGSGKTTVLVERFVAAVLEDGLEVGRLLAITFTDKAAGELRARVRARLIALGRPDAARDLDGAWVSTIHGFCTHVLRAHAVAAGLDPAFAVLDESAARGLRADAWEGALAAFLADRRGTARADALDLAAGWGADRLQEAILTVHDTLRSQGQSRPRLPPPRPRASVPEALAALRAATTEAVEQLRTARGGLKTVDAARAVLSACAERLAREGDPLPGEVAGWKLSTGAAELKADPCLAFTAAAALLAAALDDREALHAHALLDELLADLAARYAAAKRAGARVDFDDLELAVRDLFVAEPGIATGYAERFDRIMLDEFQDTNRLQLELLGHLDRDATFLVGDELQSIYGFRHADVGIFRRARAEHEMAGTAAVLRTNWRSAPAVLETINGAWGADVHPRYVPLVPGRREPADAEPRVELLLSAERWDDPDAVDGRLADDLAAGLPAGERLAKLAEARAVARRLRALVDAGACREQDVAVLLRAATDMGLYERALEREGFATLAAGGRGYWLRQPVQDLTSYLAALANPQDELALYGALGSPLCGLTSDGLAHVAAISRSDGDGVWAALRAPALAARLSAQDGARLRAFVERFEAERAQRTRYGLDELLERAVTRSGYDLHVLRLPGGRRRLANVHKLLRLAAAYEAAHGRDVRGFIDHATAEVEADAREAEAPIELGDEPAIRLMTVHAAKGLEFGVVVLADLGRGRNAQAPDLLVDGDRVGLRLVRLGAKNARALDFTALADEAKAAEAEEERRVLHVAFTRARERLILAGVAAVGPDATWPKPGPTASPLSWMGPRIAPDLPARLADDPAPTIDRAEPAGRVHIAVHLVAPETAPQTLGLAAPPPPGAQLGFFATADADRLGRGAPAGGRGPSGASDPDAVALGGAAAGGRGLSGASGSDAEALFAAGLTATLTDPALGLDPAPADVARAARAWLEAATLAASTVTPTGKAAEVTAPGAVPSGPLSYSQLSAHARCGYRWYLERGLRLPASAAGAPVPAIPPPPTPTLDPRARGTLAHLVLEELDPKRPEVPAIALLHELAEDRDIALTDADAQELHGLLSRFVTDSPVLRRLAAARRVRTEARFALPLHGRPGAPLLQGAIDVLAEEADGTVLVVDWKTDRLDGTDPAGLTERHYAIQRRLYALAALATHAPRVQVAYAYLEVPEPLLFTYAPVDRARLEQEIATAAAPMLRGEHPVAAEPHLGLCAGCPGRGGLCSHPLERTDRVLEGAWPPLPGRSA